MNTNELGFEEARSAIKEYLPIFLKESGFQSTRNDTMFRSFYPDTQDNHPSLHVFKHYDGDMIYHDFSTHRTGDIFIANSIINGAPLIGKDFITDNMKVLGDRYGISFKIKPLSEEEIEVMNIKYVNKMVRDIIVYNFKYGKLDPKVEEYVNLKGFTQDHDALDYSIGYVPNWNDFISELKARGIDEDYLEEVGIQKYLFNSNNLIFSIIDQNKVVRGFAARNCYFDKDNNMGSKYYNSENNALFNKSSILYNLDKAINRSTGKYSSLYIAEGQTDAIAIDKVNLKGVAIGSTKFTHEHIALLQQLGETDIVFILDGDDAGIKNTARNVTKVMEGIRDFRVRIVTIPDGLDPEEYIRKYGREALLRLEHITAFEWRLQQLQEKTDLDNYEMAEKVIPLIVNESSSIQRDKMCNLVADICSIPIDTIRQEVNNIANNDEIKMLSERNSVLDNIIKNLKQNPREAEVILTGALKQINNIADKHSANIYGPSEYLNELDNIKMLGEMGTDEDYLNYYRMPLFENKMRGSTAGKLFLLGGQPNAGKTAFLITLIINLLKAQDESIAYNQLKDPSRENNISIIFHSVDDVRKDIVPKFAAALASEYYKEIFINAMNAPHRYIYKNKDAVLHARNMAYATLKKWGRDGRLIIKDSGMGTRLVNGLHSIRTLKQDFPDRHFIFVLDNMYNLTDFDNFEQETKRVGERINTFKHDIVESENVMGLATVEYKKSNGSGFSRQELNELVKDSKALEYRANWMAHLLNESYTNEENTDMYFWDPAIPIDKMTRENRSPIVTLDVTKNKITSYKGKLHYYFLPNRALHLEISKNEIGHLSEPLQNKLRKFYYSDSEEIVTNKKSVLDLCIGQQNEELFSKVS